MKLSIEATATCCQCENAICRVAVRLETPKINSSPFAVLVPVDIEPIDSGSRWAILEGEPGDWVATCPACIMAAEEAARTAPADAPACPSQGPLGEGCTHPAGHGGKCRDKLGRTWNR